MIFRDSDIRQPFWKYSLMLLSALRVRNVKVAGQGVSSRHEFSLKAWMLQAKMSIWTHDIPPLRGGQTPDARAPGNRARATIPDDPARPAPG
jgi:hypothetical protein